ncbi:hypothetical protein ACROYT_G016743 [Oculina patagonica]
MFEVLNQASAPRRGEMHENQLAQMLVDMQQGNEESGEDKNSKEESEMKGENNNITKDEYQYCQQEWEDNEMSTFKDFLVWCNNLDVVPFLEVLARIKDSISVPGLTL